MNWQNDDKTFLVQRVLNWTLCKIQESELKEKKLI